MTYHQITSEERYTISTLRKEGYSQAEIARTLGRHRSSICRELKRNSSPYDGSYRPFVASEHARARRWRSRRNQRFGAEEWESVVELLLLDWSPEQISGWLHRTGGVSISHETIYRYVWKDKAEGGELYKHLRGASKQRRKRYSTYDSRGRLTGKRHISERPRGAESRNTIGHWEVDTVVGGEGATDCVVTLVERKTGFALVGKLPDRRSESLSKRLEHLIRLAPDQVATITADNGTEFHDYASVEERTDVKFYFATPYHSWERGTNENFNGLLRQYLPKRKSMRSVTQSDCTRIARRLNQRPRKRLGYRTPEECFYGKS